MQIGKSAGAECKSVIQETNKLVEQRLEENGKKLKAFFDAAEVYFCGFFVFCFFCFLFTGSCDRPDNTNSNFMTIYVFTAWRC